ncbi:MAG: AEC family transporter [Flavobacteriaceae bacterium]
MQEILGLTFPFFGLIFVGFAAGKIFKVPHEGLAWLSTYLVWFALPALFFELIAKTPFEQLLSFGFVLTAVFSTYCAFAISFVIGYLLSRGNIAESVIQGELGAYSNIGYMGPPLTLSAFGPAAAAPAALIFAFENLLHFSLVPLLVAVGTEDDVAPLKLAGRVLRRFILHPFILATVAGFVGAYFAVQPWAPVQTMLTYLKNSAAPCALFTMGVTVALRPVKRVPWEMPILTAVKLVLHPAIVWVMLSLVGDFDPVWVYTAVMMAALPPALNVFVMAQQYNVYVERASTTILFGTVVSVFTVTGLLYLITAGLLPSDLFPASP